MVFKEYNGSVLQRSPVFIWIIPLHIINPSSSTHSFYHTVKSVKLLMNNYFTQLITRTGNLMQHNITQVFCTMRSDIAILCTNPRGNEMLIFEEICGILNDFPYLYIQS